MSELMELRVVSDSGMTHTAYLDVGGPLIITPDEGARQGNTRLTTPSGSVCVALAPAELRRRIHEHRGVR